MIQKEDPNRKPLPAELPGITGPCHGVGADVGASLTKLVFRSSDGSLRFDLLPSVDPDETARRISAAQPREIGLTGAGSTQVSGLLKLDTARFAEFEAWRQGTTALLSHQGFTPPVRDLVVSLGTGTSILLIEPGRATRVGGTALGGGTLLGLGAGLVGTTDFDELMTLTARGDRRRVDLLVSDIDPDGVIPLPRDLTASAMAKLGMTAETPDPSDLAHAVIGLIGENVGLLAGALAALTGALRIVFAGSTLRRNPTLRNLLACATAARGREVIFPKDGEFAGAIGALELASKNDDA